MASRTGIATTDNADETAVIVTLRATSARANQLNMLLAFPPDAHVISMRPTASSSGRPVRTAAEKPSSGIQPYCEARPIETPRGRMSARRKSAVVSVAPRPSMSRAVKMTTAMRVGPLSNACAYEMGTWVSAHRTVWTHHVSSGTPKCSE
jgi:hypothetical protein